MVPLGRLLETHHHCQVSMMGYRSLNQLHHLSLHLYLSMLQGLKTARSLHTIINRDHWPLSQGTSRTGCPSSVVHERAARTDNCQLVQADAGCHQVLKGKGSLPDPHLPLLDHISTVVGGDSWCLAIITSHGVDLGGAKLPRPSQMDSMNAHKAKLRCQGGV